MMTNVGPEGGNRESWSGGTWPGGAHRPLMAALAVALATGAGFVAFRFLDLADVAMLYILCITIVATRYGRWTALLASLLSVACLDWFFIPPLFSFSVADIRHLGTFGTMLFVGWVVANLAEGLRTQTRLAEQREGHTGALYRLGTVLAEGGTAPMIQARVEAFLAGDLGLTALVLLPDAQGQLSLPSRDGLAFDAKGLGLAQQAQAMGVPVGRGTATLPGAQACFLPMTGTETPAGVLALFMLPEGAPLALPLAVAAQVSLALERARLAEERTEARIRAEHEHLKNTLLSSVSHDLRTPLGTITGATTSLLEPGPEAGPQDQRLLLLSIHQESCRLERLVNNLLELTKLESGQVRVNKEWVPLEEVVGSAISRLEEQLGDRPLVVDLGEVWVPLDPVLIEQVLLNLLDNALKFSPPGSPLTIRGWVEDHDARLLVADAGPGFQAGEEQKIFDKLYRGSLATLASGAGLGLAICRGIIQAHSGSISARTGPQGGAEILLSLPIEGVPPVLPLEITP